MSIAPLHFPRFILLQSCLLAACSAAAPAAPDWAALGNPVLEYADWSVKDYAGVQRDGTWFVFFSAFYEDRGRVRSHVVEVTTRDWKQYSAPVFNLDGREDDWVGMCSPDIAKFGDTYVLCFNSWGDKPGVPNQLFQKTSTDLRQWSPRRPLAANLTKGRRAIDAALAPWNGRALLLWKEDQKLRCAIGDSPDAGFRLVGDGCPRTFMADGQEVPWNENYQIVPIEGNWHVLASTRTEQNRMVPVLYTVSNGGRQESDWLKLVDGRILPMEDDVFNTASHSNASALMLPGRQEDGYWYLLYAGTTEGKTFLRRGHNKLGLARSKDLIHWAPAGKSDPAPAPPPAPTVP